MIYRDVGFYTLNIGQREKKKGRYKINCKEKDKEEEDKEKHIPNVNGVFKNEKLIHENWNVVQNKNIKNKQQHDLNQKGHDIQQNYNNNNKGHKDNRGDKAMTTANKFKTLLDLTDNNQDATENSVENLTSDSKKKGGDMTKQWVKATFGKTHDTSKITNNQSEEETKKNNKNIEDATIRNNENKDREKLQITYISQKKQQNSQETTTSQDTQNNLHMPADSENLQALFTPKNHQMVIIQQHKESRVLQVQQKQLHQ